MEIRCVEYCPTAKGGAMVKLQLELAHGPMIEVSGWTMYNGSGKWYVNPPIAHRSGQIQNIVTFARRSDREAFRVAALAAIEAFRAEKARSKETKQ
jgi:hypothetical protein